MPPRKSNTSANGDDGAGGGISVEDLSLPKTMIQRLAKGVLPANTQIQKDALLALSKSATVFVNYLSSHAGENATRANKKTIQPKDVFDALHDLEFDEFFPRVQVELDKYNTIQCDKRNTYRRKVREDQLAKKAEAAKEVLTGAPSQAVGGAESDASMLGAGEGSGERAAKKQRLDSGEAMAVDEDEEDQDDNGDEDEDEDDDDDDVEHDDIDDGDDEGDEDPNAQLVERDEGGDPGDDRGNDGIGDEALDGEESD